MRIWLNGLCKITCQQASYDEKSKRFSFDIAFLFLRGDIDTKKDERVLLPYELHVGHWAEDASKLTWLHRIDVAPK
jgi:hypothetical protein